MLSPEEISAHADQVVLLSDAIGIRLGIRDTDGTLFVNGQLLIELLDTYARQGASGEEVNAGDLASAVVSLSLAAARQTQV